MNMTKSITIVGVGGQGTLLASRILGNMLVDEGFDVKVSEVHGMSQRGGSVVTYVRYGDKVASPVVEKGESDVILAFELCEGARWISTLKKGGTLVVNTQQIDPMPVVTGAMSYPENIQDKLRAKDISVIEVDALKYAEEAGSAKAVNVVMIGALSKYMEFSEDKWVTAIKNTVPGKFTQMNLKAFELGRNIK